MFADVRSIQKYVALPGRIDAGDEFNAALMFALHLLEQRRRVAASIRSRVDLPVALMADQNQIVDRVQVSRRNSIVAAWAFFAEGIDMGLLRDVHALARD